ncbi:MAG: NAD(P)/FAD-dependent oxidoreductase [Ruthenibacterium lactatiformans]
METNFDCIVIGAGPAGLSAALNLRQRGKTVLVVHSGETLLAKAEQVDNYLGMPGLSGKQMMERFTQHARDAGAVLRKGRAGNVMPFGGRFMVNLDGDILETGAVVLACGVSRQSPCPGRPSCWAAAFYCATCDGMLYRGRAVAVWVSEAPQEANFLHGIGCSVTYIAGRRPDTLEAGVAFRAGRVEAVEGGAAVEAVRVGGAALPVQGVFILRAATPPDARCPALRWKTAL